MGRSKRLFTAALACLVMVSVAVSQSKQTDKKTQQDDPSIQLQSQLLEIHAVVTDKKGNVIKNLKKEDFEIFENNNPQTISFFSTDSIPTSTSGNPAATGQKSLPPQTPTRTVAIYVDTLNLSISSLQWTKQALNKFIDQQLTDGDAAAIITSTGSLGILEQFTRSKQILHMAVSRLSPGPRVSDSMFTPYLAAMVDHDDPTAINVGIELLRLEEHVLIDNRTILIELTKAKARDILDYASYRRKATLLTLKTLAERIAERKGQRMITVLSDGFTLRSQSSGVDTSDLDAAITRAVRSGVVMYTINAKGLTPPVGFTGTTAGTINPQLLSALTSYMSASESEAEDGLNALAVDTGGVAYRNQNDIVGMLTKALDENQSYYSFAYYSTGDKSKKYRNITIKIAGHPEYIVRTQKGYSPEELFNKKEEAMTADQKFYKAIASPMPVTNINIAAMADFLANDADPLRVIFQAYIDGSKINYVEQNQRHHVDLDVITVVYDSRGKTVNTITEKVQGDLLPDRLEKAKQSGYRFMRPLSLKPGLYQIRIGVREPSTERVGTAVAWIDVPDSVKGKLTTSSVFLIDKAQTVDAAVMAGSDSNESQSRIRDGIRFYKQGSEMTYNLRIYQKNGATDDNTLSMQTQIADSGVVLKQGDWQQIGSRIIAKHTAGIDVGDKIKLDMKPGIYELRVSVKDEKTKHPIEQSVVFGIEN